MTGTNTRATRCRSTLRVLGVTTAVTVAAALALSGCGGGGTPSSSRTVTVWVDPPKTSDARPVPTVASDATSPATPTAMVAGQAKGMVRSFDEAMHKIDGTHDSRDYATFVSPSGNIFCVVDAGGATCEVRSGRVSPPGDVCSPGGPTEVGRIELRPSGAVPVCTTDTIRSGNPPKLPYGTSTHVSGTDVTCLSEEAGVTCIDPQARHGFFIARGGFATF